MIVWIKIFIAKKPTEMKTPHWGGGQLYCVFNIVDDGILALTGKTSFNASKNHSVSDLLCNCCTSLNSFKRDMKFECCGSNCAHTLTQEEI